MSKGERKGITNRESHKETGLDKQWNSYIYEKQGCQDWEKDKIYVLRLIIVCIKRD